MFFARVSTVPRETEGVAVCHCFFLARTQPCRSGLVAISPLDGGPEGTGGVCVKAPTDVEGERLALCGLNNTRVGHYGGHG
jgi:hypothetical protein